jgi:hypothetical protein
MSRTAPNLALGGFLGEEEREARWRCGSLIIRGTRGLSPAACQGTFLGFALHALE